MNLRDYWLSLSWWQYVLDDTKADKAYGPALNYFQNIYSPFTNDNLFNPIGYARNWLSRFVCRWKNHPEGVYWYTLSEFEPDMHCKGCGEDLG